MSFDESYQLLELTGDEGVKTFVARRISTGTTVTVFLFVSAQAQAHAELLDQLRTADRAQWPDLIEIGDNRGTIYVAMKPHLTFAELKERASSLKTAPPAHSEHKPEEFTRAGIWRIPPSLQSTPSRAEHPVEESSIFDKQPLKVDAPSAPGSFTQMFQTAAPPIEESVPEIPVVPPAPPAAPAPMPSAPGSFTQMFQTAAPPIGESVPEVPVVPPAPPAAPAPMPSAPGSFTQMFQTAAPPIGESVPEIPVVPPSPPAAPEPKPSAPGSFTQMFQTAAPPIGESVPEVPAVPPAPPAAPAPMPSAPGEFTRVFQAAAPPINEATVETPKAPPKQSSPGSFTQMFQAAASPMGEQKAKAPQKAPEQSGPGEFTRFFNASSAAPPTAAPILPKQEAQGDFASIFGSGDRPAGPPSTGTGIFQSSSATPAIKLEQAGSASSLTPPPAFTPPPGNFTRIFGETPSEVSLPGPIAVPSPPSAPSPASAPGEYTRMFSAQPLPQEPIAAPAATAIKAPEPTAQPKRSSMLIPVLIGVIVLLLAAIAVILVALKK